MTYLGLLVGLQLVLDKAALFEAALTISHCMEYVHRFLVSVLPSR